MTNTHQGVSEGTAAIAALQLSQNTKNHDDDRNCPDPKNKCKDCGGQNQMRTTGADAGCTFLRLYSQR